MKILVTGGGSAGHITPILSVATELKAQHPHAHIRYIGQVGDGLSSIVLNNSAVEGNWSIFAGKWRRYHGVGFWHHMRDWRTVLKNIRDIVYLAIGFVQSVWLLLWWRPNVVFAKGGFVSLPVGFAAALLRIPLVTHDSDAQPGVTNRLLARFAQKQCVALPAQYYKQYDSRKVVQTGVPVSDAYIPLQQTQVAKLKQKLQIPNDAQVLTIFGGSLGAIRLNNAVLEVLPTLLAKLPKLQVFHITGSQQAEEITAAYATLNASQSSRIWTYPFVTNLHELTGIADVVVARSGASSMAELGAQHKAVILVPNPYLTGGHQTYNAHLVAEQDAALVVTEKQIHTDITVFEETIFALLGDSLRQKQLGANLAELTIANAASNIAKIIVEVAA